jgi:hypothetical protein
MKNIATRIILKQIKKSISNLNVYERLAELNETRRSFKILQFKGIFDYQIIYAFKDVVSELDKMIQIEIKEIKTIGKY